MKIGIIVHSHTGNTLSVAEKLKEELIRNGRQAELKRVAAVNEDPQAKGPVVLETAPPVDAYDILIFGGPVRAFSISPVMKAYLKQLDPLNGKEAACFVTQQLPYPQMGGNRAIKQMTAFCEAKGAKIYGTGIGNWSSKAREEKIIEVVEKLCCIGS